MCPEKGYSKIIFSKTKKLYDGRGIKICQNCVTSLMNDPLLTCLMNFQNSSTKVGADTGVCVELPLS